MQRRPAAGERRRQAAAAEVLRLIADAPTDLFPVFERIVKNAARICQSVLSAVYRTDGKNVHLIAHDQFSAESVAAVRKAYPAPISSSPAALGSGTTFRKTLPGTLLRTETQAPVSDAVATQYRR